MHENSPIEGLSDSQQAKLFRTLLLQIEREDITFKNLSGGQLSVRDLVVKLQTLTGIKAGPKVVSVAHPGLLNTVHSLEAASHRVVALCAARPQREAPVPSPFFSDIHIGNFRRIREFDALFTFNQLLLQAPFGEVTLKLPGQCHGWVTRMRARGYKVSSRAARFGQQEHTLVKDGVSITLLQGGSAVVRNKRQWGSFIDPAILADLRDVGALIEEKVPEKEFA